MDTYSVKNQITLDYEQLCNLAGEFFGHCKVRGKTIEIEFVDPDSLISGDKSSCYRRSFEEALEAFITAK